MFSNNICPQARIDLGAIKANYLAMRELIGQGTIAAAVVKNDAYGLGAQRVAESLYEVGCRDFWVAYLKEAIDIRRVLPLDCNIYFLQGFHQSYINLIKTYKIIPVINSIDEFNNAKRNNIPMVLHFDTGLSRLGLRPEDVQSILENIKHEHVCYVISHLSSADDKESTISNQQKIRFDAILSEIKSVVPNVKAGVSASAGALLGREFNYDMVRIGAFLYGIEISADSIIKPKNVFSLKTTILQKYEIEKGTAVGYGATYTATKKMTVAILSIGYADGIKRSLSNTGTVLFYDSEKNPYRADIIGRISMDLLACDVTDIPEHITQVNLEAYILDENYSINDMAKDAGTIPYEILTSINFKSKRFEIEYV